MRKLQAHKEKLEGDRDRLSKLKAAHEMFSQTLARVDQDVSGSSKTDSDIQHGVGRRDDRAGLASDSIVE